MDMQAHELAQATGWLHSGSPLLAHYGCRVLVRLGSDRAHRNIDAALLLCPPGPVIRAICSAATALGSRYKPAPKIVERILRLWMLDPAASYLHLLQAGAQYLPVAVLHSLLATPLGADALRLLVLTGDPSAFEPALEHLRQPRDLWVFDLAEFARIQDARVPTALASLRQAGDSHRPKADGPAQARTPDERGTA